MRLREYQIDIINQCRQLMMSGVRRLIVQSPTGSGKTVLASWMLKQAESRGKSVWFVVHRRELVDQASATFNEFGIEHGIVQAGSPESDARVNVCSIQTLIRRLDKMLVPNMIVWDEVHHIASKSWTKVFDKYPQAFHIGLSATPSRMDGKGLYSYFDAIVHGPTVTDLIGSGNLSSYRLIAPSDVDMAGSRTSMGDWRICDIENIVNRKAITGNAVNEYKKRCNGKRALVFCASIKHSKSVAAEFRDRGILAEHLDGKISKKKRDQLVADFRVGKIQVLSNCGLFSEGFDVPGVEALVMLRPTQSLNLYLQQAGRALRMSEGKETAIILDHVGNCIRHGLPNDIHQWELEGREKRPKDAPPSVKICPECFYAQNHGCKKCKYCDNEFKVEERIISAAKGKMVEIELKEFRRFEQSKARTMDELIQLGIDRGHKNPRGWARHIYNYRKRRSRGRQHWNKLVSN